MVYFPLMYTTKVYAYMYVYTTPFTNNSVNICIINGCMDLDRLFAFL
jgi:hypothetical protein